MSKLVQLSEMSAGYAENHAPLVGRNREQAAMRIYQDASTQMQSQRRGFSEEFRNIENTLQKQVAIVATAQLADVDLLDPKKYSQFKKEIESWNVSGNGENVRPYGKVREALLEMLPAARQKQQLQKHCEEYRKYLQNEIGYYLFDQHDVSHHDVMGDNMDHFLAGKGKQIQIKDEGIQQAIQKYQAVRALQRTLQTDKPATEQVRDFRQELQKARKVIERSRDSVGMTFLKAVATVVTLGVAALAGIWSVKGEKTAQKLATVLAKPIASLSLPVAMATARQHP